MSSESPAQDEGEDLRKKKRSWKAIIAFIVLAGIGLPASWFLWLLSYAFAPGPPYQVTSPVESVGPSVSPHAADQQISGVSITIPHNSGLYKIRAILAEKGLIKKDRRFVLTARFFDVTNKLKAGEYYFSYGQTPYEILRVLEAGMVVQKKLTIPEGTTMYQIADMLADQGVAERDSFLELMRDQQFIQGLGLDTESLEGYLFPDTYQLSGGQSAEFVARLMIKRMLEVLDELGVDPEKNIPDRMKKSFTRHEVLTLASIVEKETAQGDERPMIARVFLNRLRRGMRLQTDPTVIYGLTDFDGNLRKKDLSTPTPYNTYMIRGLPPGPIGSPGKAAIAAVLHPSEQSYLYFVSKNDDTHYFSKSLIEHNEAVKKYQMSRKYRIRMRQKKNETKE